MFQSDMVVADYDFVPQEPNELPFKRGDIITIINRDHQHWWKGELNGKQGLLPSTYVSILLVV